MPALRKRPDEIGDEAYVGCLSYGMATKGVKAKDLLSILGYKKTPTVPVRQTPKPSPSASCESCINAIF